MKSLIQRLLQSILGFENYLYIFSRYKIKTLKWDEGEKDFFYFLKLIPENSTVLDLGANIGIMTYHLSQRAGHGNVLAFEPIPWNANTLRKIIKHHQLKNVTLREIALGNNSDPLRMVVPVVNGVKKQGLSHVISPDITEFNKGIIVEVQQLTLDSLLEEMPDTISAIKIDVENFEYPVFQGASQLITRHRPIIYCELWDNQNRQNCFQFFKTINYDIMVVENQNLVTFAPGLHRTQNFIFIPKNQNHA
ncbi:MAG: FkbM family methyltransferase [Bacteroidia bacterium]